MSNERIDEFLAWRRRLDDPAGIPGEGLDDRDATWERLMDKIGDAPRRRRLFGYRLTAACVLLALIPAARFLYDRHNHLVVLHPVAIQRAASSPVPSPAVSPAGPPESVASAVHPPSIQSPGVHRHAQAGVTRVAPAPIAMTEAASPADIIPVDSLVPQLIDKPFKTKYLRIVHINELPGGAGLSPAGTTSGAHKHFEISLAPSELHLSSSN